MTTKVIQYLLTLQYREVSFEESVQQQKKTDLKCIVNMRTKIKNTMALKAGLYRIWCGVHTLGDSGVNTLGDTSAFVNPAGQILLTRRGKIRMYGVGIVFEFYIVPL